MSRRVLAALGTVMALAVAACGPAGSDLLVDVQVAEPPRSPLGATGVPRLSVAYRLTQPARVSATLRAADGREWTVHDAAPRPVAGAYRLALDGTVPGPGPNERRVLPNGDYQVTLQAEAASGPVQRVTAVMPVRGANTDAPRVDELAAFPERISPNFDAQDDIMAISYRLSKKARVVPFVERALDDGSRQRSWTGEQRSLDAGEQRLRWDGTRNGRPLADGAYELGLRATDAAGNVSEARIPIWLEAGGSPEAKLVFARIAPRQVIRGSAVCLDVVVRNTGTTILRTQGPNPDYVYDSFDSYSSIEEHRYVEHAGYWRVGLDAAGFNSTVGARYPWRWGFGRDLPPGEEASVHGCVRLNHEQTRMVFFGALVQENAAIHDSGAGMVEVRISP